MFGCVVCGRISLRHICAHCLKGSLAPTFQSRKIDGFEVFSFYKYSEIEPLLLYKYQMVGSFIFSELAAISFAKFAENFEFENKILVVPVDDHTENGYSHTAILAKSMQNDLFIPSWGSLRATNRVRYAGQSLEFRRKNPRNFEFKGAKHKEIVLVDDTITTGSTLLEAKATIEKSDFDVLFALTLADAKE